MCSRKLSGRGLGRSAHSASLAENACCCCGRAAGAKCWPRCSPQPGANVEQVVVYESRDVESADADIAAALAAGAIDFTTVTSSAIARSLVRMFGESLRKTRLAAISPLTADVLAELGYSAEIVADSYTSDGLVAAILAATSGNSNAREILPKCRRISLRRVCCETSDV